MLRYCVLLWRVGATSCGKHNTGTAHKVNDSMPGKYRPGLAKNKDRAWQIKTMSFAITEGPKTVAVQSGTGLGPG